MQVRPGELTEDEFLRQARAVSQVTRRFAVRCIIGGSVEVARAVQADGVHLSTGASELRCARRVLGDDYILGGTADDALGLVGLVEAGASYVALSPYRIIRGPSEQPGGLGHRGVVAVCHEAAQRLGTVPVIVTGGVGLADIEEILSAGATGIGICRGIVESQDISAATEQALEVLERLRV